MFDYQYQTPAQTRQFLSTLCNQTEIWGHELGHFHPCCTLCAQFWIYKGTVYIDGIGGGAQPIKFRKRHAGKFYRKCTCIAKSPPKNSSKWRKQIISDKRRFTNNSPH